jgi:hypothetical protein
VPRSKKCPTAIEEESAIVNGKFGMLAKKPVHIGFAVLLTRVGVIGVEGESHPLELKPAARKLTGYWHNDGPGVKTRKRRAIVG